MEDTPPRRSRPPQNNNDDSSFPLIPFLIGVIVLGFVIGAGLSMAKRGTSSSSQQVVAATSPSPMPEPTATSRPTLAPLSTALPKASPTEAIATSEHSPSAKGESSPGPSSSPSPKVSESASAAATPRASPTPVASATAHATPSPHPSHAHVVAVAAATPTVAVTVVPTHTPKPSPTATAMPATAAPSVAPVTIAPAGTTIDADSEFGRLSANVVRQYLRALARGDTESAYGAFGAAPGSSAVNFPEQTVMSGNAQIGLVQSRGSSDTQTVNVTITSGGSNYYGTYNVHRTQTGAAVITAHSINKG